jgi:hypothetical protein
MIRAIMAAAIMTAIAACNAPVDDVSLAGLDLNDTRLVTKIARQLPDREGAAFTTYALVHWPASKNYCGRPIGESGRTAKTVGEAVAQTLKFEADLERTRQAARAGPASQVESLREQRTLLTDQIEQLVLKRDVLYARLGGEAQATPEAKLLEKKMLQLQNRRSAVENQLLQVAAAT